MDAPAYPQSRNQAFAQGNGTAPVSTPQAPQADPMFHASSVLDMYNNIPSGIGEDPRTTGAMKTKTYGITQRPPAVSGSNQGSSPMNV